MAYYAVERRVNRRSPPFMTPLSGFGQLPAMIEPAGMPSDIGMAPPTSSVVATLKREAATGVFRDITAGTGPITQITAESATGVFTTPPLATEPPVARPQLDPEGIVLDSEGNVIPPEMLLPQPIEGEGLGTRLFGDCGWICPVDGVGGFLLGMAFLRMLRR